jgi:hypothetical protein
VPAGADCYLLKSILHNWDEGVVRTDLNMLAGLGGRERTLDEYGALLGEAGLRIDSVSALSFEFSVIELRSANQSISAPPGS